MAKSSISRAVKLVGTETPDGKRRELRAGPLTAMLDNGALRYIRHGGAEVLRGIAYLVRDKNWGTYAPAIENLKVRQGRSGFSVSYTATCRDADQAIRYEARIEGRDDGTLRFSARGLPLSDFLTNRTGFVVLHPLEGVVGAPVEIVHTDGKKEKTRFPKVISPGQPVFEIRSLRHQVTPGVFATVLMEGNKYEMEDHRNWMDASYKTYVCSLLDPWPYTLKKGEAFEQSITVTVAGKAKGRAARAGGGGTAVSVGSVSGAMPAIALGVPMAEARAALAKSELIGVAAPSALICQIDGRRPGQAEAASAFRQLSEKTGIPVRLEIVLPAKEKAETEMASVARAVAEGGLKPEAVIVTQMHDLKSFQPNTPRPWGPTYEEMAAAARAAFPGTKLGGGMLSFFTELNRKRPPLGVFDFITHTVCPIVHAADDISVMETLEALPSIFASTRAMIGKQPYHVGPSSIPCRDNPYGAAVAANPDNGRVCLSDMDPRQRGLFAAAWSLGLAARAAAAKLDSLALGSATGAQGAIYRKLAHGQPGYDGANAQVYPVYHVIAGLAAAAGAKVLATNSAAPSAIAALGTAGRKGKVLWLANLTAEKQKVKVTGFAGPGVLHVLGEGSFARLIADPAWLSRGGTALRKVGAVELPAYGVARIASG